MWYLLIPALIPVAVAIGTVLAQEIEVIGRGLTRRTEEWLKR